MNSGVDHSFGKNLWQTLLNQLKRLTSGSLTVIVNTLSIVLPWSLATERHSGDRVGDEGDRGLYEDPERTGELGKDPDLPGKSVGGDERIADADDHDRRDATILGEDCDDRARSSGEWMVGCRLGDDELEEDNDDTDDARFDEIEATRTVLRGRSVIGAEI